MRQISKTVTGDRGAAQLNVNPNTCQDRRQNLNLSLECPLNIGTIKGQIFCELCVVLPDRCLFVWHHGTLEPRPNLHGDNSYHSLFDDLVSSQHNGLSQQILVAKFLTPSCQGTNRSMFFVQGGIRPVTQHVLYLGQQNSLIFPWL